LLFDLKSRPVFAQTIHYLFRRQHSKCDGKNLGEVSERCTLGDPGLLTIASTIHASSSPAPFDITSRVKRRRNTTRPDTSVKASTMMLTRVPAGVVLLRSILAIVLDKRVDRMEKRRKPMRRIYEGLHGSSLHNGKVGDNDELGCSQADRDRRCSARSVVQYKNEPASGTNSASRDGLSNCRKNKRSLVRKVERH
jgi:hypothetical protein